VGSKKEVPDPPEGFAVMTPNEWLPVWDRVITSTPVKAVGYAAATRFAGWTDGAEIRPGNVILARICGCSTRTVERALATIRDDFGLMHRYHKGCREGDADIYRLTLPDNALERIPMLNPDWSLPASAPDTQSGADSLSGGDTQSAPDFHADLPDTVSGAHPTESRRTSTETSTRPPYDANTGFVTADVEGAHAREANNGEFHDGPRIDGALTAEEWEARKRHQLDELEAWMRQHPESAGTQGTPRLSG
jgi:hypothetical protein